MTVDWTMKGIRLRSVAPLGEVPKNETTSYHFPRLKRSIIDGPGNRSSITECSCGARHEGIYEYRPGYEHGVLSWYAEHAGLVGGGATVSRILRQYDEALDEIDYPDHLPPHVKKRIDPKTILVMLLKVDPA